MSTDAVSEPDLPTDPVLFWGSVAPLELGDASDGPGEESAVDALDERGQPPIELGGGGLRRELEAMYAVIRADAVARLRWLS
ncbi:MAG TPA: hypothetical protein VNB94_04205 [Mycobacteriales bacterium]|nr:hypothetical protein [Mycobacteriales bacterium]